MPPPAPHAAETLGSVLKQARVAGALSLREVERRTGIRSGHLSQIETGTIAKPEMAILWDLAGLYGLEFGRLLSLAGLARATGSSGRERQRITVALRALGELSPQEQTEALSYIAELKARRDRRP
jgi:transcriptional regulator with XRE-family HTH domain